MECIIPVPNLIDAKDQLCYRKNRDAKMLELTPKLSLGKTQMIGLLPNRKL